MLFGNNEATRLYSWLLEKGECSDKTSNFNFVDMPVSCPFQSVSIQQCFNNVVYVDQHNVYVDQHNVVYVHQYNVVYVDQHNVVYTDQHNVVYTGQHNVAVW